MNSSLRRLTAAIAITVVSTAQLPTAVLAADPVSQTFTYTGAEQLFVVPEGVTRLDVVLIGGKGGGEGAEQTVGGFGARVDGRLPVTPGAMLYIEVGGNGGNGAYPAGTGGGGGFNGGAAGGTGLDLGSGTARGAGGGGGASDIRTVPRSDGGSLESRLIVAAGGGGGGTGANGAPAGAAGNDVVVSGTVVTTGGGPGTADSGGAGGTGDVSGASGSLGNGGGGAAVRGPGGGGGGGLYGGGSGGGASIISWGASGGGGSNFTGDAFNTSATIDSAGVPSIMITFAPAGSNTGTVAAQVDVVPSAACLELASTSVDFGTLPLGSEWAIGTPQVQFTNCGVVDQLVLVHGTDASGSGAAWDLVDFTDCSDPAMGTDTYGLGISLTPDSFLGVIETNRELAFQPPGAINANDALISTACSGSSGAGSLMTMQLVFVATEAP